MVPRLGAPLQQYLIPMNLYKDSKELPIYNYKRIVQTGDFLYMVKGYDGEQTEADLEHLSAEFERIVKDYAIEMGGINSDIVQFGRIESAKSRIDLYLYAIAIIELQIGANALREKVGLNKDDETIKELLKSVKVPKKSDLREQAEVLKDKIEKLQNEINEATAKLGKTQNKEDQSREADIDEVIVHVSLVLEFPIDERKTSLHQFGILQKQARSKIDRLARMNNK